MKGESMALVRGKSQARDYNGSLFVTVVFVAANNIRIQCLSEVYPLEFQLCWCTEGKEKKT